VKRVTYFEIDVPRCANTYGVSPCTASIPATGSQKCVNCFSSCQDQANFNLTTETMRFAQSAAYLDRSIDALPNIEDVKHTPAVIGLGDNLGERASLEVTFIDSPHSDTGDGYDPYVKERTYNPWDQGTHWGKFRARYPFFQGADCRLYRGEHTDTLDTMDVRYFVAESMEGPDMDGQFSIVAKDPLKKLDGDRAQAPVANTGMLASTLAAGATSFSVTPSGVGSEYAETGYVTIGGNEIVRFSRGGNDANTLLYLAFLDADADTTPEDFSSFGRSVTASGNAQVDTDEPSHPIPDANGAALFDGTGDFFNVPDSADWVFGTGDFTLDMWVYHDDAPGAIESYMSHGTDASNQWKFGRNADGTLRFRLEIAGNNVIVVDGSTIVTSTTWHHVAVVRRDTTFYFYVDGELDVIDPTSSAIPNFTGTLRIGSDYDSLAFDGWIGVVRISNVARFNKYGFATPIDLYSSSGDLFNLEFGRGFFETQDVDHEANERVQTCLRYNGVDAAIIIADLIETYGGISGDFIPIEDWQTETDLFLNAVYTGTIPEPTSVNKLVSELIEQVGLVVWWSDDPPQVNLQVLRSVASTADIIDEDIILKDTLEFEDQPNKRASQVWTFFGQRDPTRPLDEERNYRAMVATDDSDTEVQGAEPAIKKIYSRWIPLGGQTAAEHLNDVLLSRYQIAPRRFEFKLLAGGSISADPAIGYRLEATPLQGVLGAPETIPIQVTSVKSEADGETVTAEEFETDIPVGSTTDDVITLSTSENNINLEVLHDQLYPVAESGDRVICYIYSNVTIGSNSTSAPAFVVGSYATGVSVIVIVNGRIQGAGGDAGSGGDGGDRIGGGPGTSTDDGDNGQSGSDGGTAFYTRRAVSVVANEIWGGGGGGGGGGGAGYSSGSVGITAGGGGGGGGGSGRDVGDGANGGDGGSPDGDGGNSGHDGEATNQGNGGNGGDSTGASGGGGNGGNGGDPGEDGNDGQDGDGNRGGNGGNGGDAGPAIDGDSLVTLGSWDGTTFTGGATGDEDIRGPEVN
jgi:hypothetical protein